MTRKLIKYNLIIEIREDYISVLEDILKCLKWLDRQHYLGFKPISFFKLN